MSRKYLIPECQFEREILLLMKYNDKNDIRKETGCSAVISAIEKRDKSILSIGWIDQDPTKQVNRAKDYYSYKQIDAKHKIFVKKKPGSNHYLIETQDEFEPWIESIAKDKGIKKEVYKIRFGLHEYSKAIVPTNVKKYFKVIVEQNSAPFEFIKSTIEKIKQGKFKDL